MGQYAQNLYQKIICNFVQISSVTATNFHMKLIMNFPSLYTNNLNLLYNQIMKILVDLISVCYKKILSNEKSSSKYNDHWCYEEHGFQINEYNYTYWNHKVTFNFWFLIKKSPKCDWHK